MAALFFLFSIDLVARESRGLVIFCERGRPYRCRRAAVFSIDLVARESRGLVIFCERGRLHPMPPSIRFFNLTWLLARAEGLLFSVGAADLIVAAERPFRHIDLVARESRGLVIFLWARQTLSLPPSSRFVIASVSLFLT